MTWFTKLTGIEEESPEQVRRELFIEGDQIVCPDGKRFAFGRLETPELADHLDHVVTGHADTAELSLDWLWPPLVE